MLSFMSFGLVIGLVIILGVATGTLLHDRGVFLRAAVGPGRAA
ncbi:hypothetical protein [Streptomyces sp. NBC_00073]